MAFILESVLFALASAPAVGVALGIVRPRYLGPALLFLGVLALDDILTGLPVGHNALLVPGADWNWIGKVLSLAWAGLFVACTSLSRAEVGLTLNQRDGSVRPALVVTLVLASAGAAIGLAFGGDGRFDLETLLFQLTMPGLAEELAYRGVFMALLHRAFPAERGQAAFWIPAAITTLAFGLWHGLSFDSWQVSFDVLAFIFPFIGGVGFAWLQERTGSLLFPVLAHNASNTAGLLMSLL